MTDPQRVSVVIATCSMGAYLLSAIESAYGQAGKEIITLVVR